MSFVRFCEERGASRMTTDLAVEWATRTASGSEAYRARRPDVVRIFARHLQALDPATEVPPGEVLSRRQWRIPPYLYSPEEIAALMDAAGGLTAAIRAATRGQMKRRAGTQTRPGARSARPRANRQCAPAAYSRTPRDRRVGVMWPSAATSARVPDLTAG
jgi:hypothetical protein